MFIVFVKCLKNYLKHSQFIMPLCQGFLKYAGSFKKPLYQIKIQKRIKNNFYQIQKKLLKLYDVGALNTNATFVRHFMIISKVLFENVCNYKQMIS